MPEGLSLNNCLINISEDTMDFLLNSFFELFDNEFNSLIVCNSINFDTNTGEQTLPYFIPDLQIDNIGTCSVAGTLTMNESTGTGTLTGIFLKYQSGEVAECYDKLYTGTLNITESGFVPDFDEGVDINIPLNGLYARIFETNYTVPAGVYEDDPVDYDSYQGIYSSNYISDIKNLLSYNRTIVIATPYTIEVDGASTISLPTTIQIHDYDKDVDVDISIRKYTDLKTGTTYTNTIPLSEVDESILLCDDIPKLPMSVYFTRDINSIELIDK